MVRSLGRKGIEVWLGTEESDSVVPRSRYVARTVFLPSTGLQTGQWLAEVRSVLEREPMDLVLPCSDQSLVPLAQHRADFAPLARLAIPDEYGFTHSYRKDLTFALADTLGVPSPDSVAVASLDDLNAVLADDRWRFPLIVKPVSSKVWQDGRRLDLQVRSANDAGELTRMVGGLLGIGPVLIQSYFPGEGAGQEFLADRGEIVDAFQHERVHEPLSGGGSSYRRSVALDPAMLEASRKLLEALRWTGVAMVEYKRDPATGRFALMEINGRFWGSLPLAVAAGLDFPFHLFDLLVNGRRPTPAPYRLGVYCRNPGKDVGWLRERMACAGSTARALVVPVKMAAQGLSNTVLGREHWDTITLDDPVPGLVEIGRAANAFPRRLNMRARRALFGRLGSSPGWRRRQRARLRRVLRNGGTVLFICRGNICRSPFAEASARRASPERRGKGIEWISAGTYPVAGRESPGEARSAAREHQLDLDAHRSRTLDRTLIDRATAILCMDFRDYRELSDTWPHARRKLFFLGSFAEDGSGYEIADPWGQPTAAFQQCYARIAASVAGMIAALNEA